MTMDSVKLALREVITAYFLKDEHCMIYFHVWDEEWVKEIIPFCLMLFCSVVFN